MPIKPMTQISTMSGRIPQAYPCRGMLGVDPSPTFHGDFGWPGLICIGCRTHGRALARTHELPICRNQGTTLNRCSEALSFWSCLSIVGTSCLRLGFGKLADVVTCKFVCVPLQPDGDRPEPSCPEKACNLFENCTCCTFEWTDDGDVDQQLCVERPPPPPVTCDGVKCSDESDGAGCTGREGCCPYIDTPDIDQCSCGTSWADANTNKIPCKSTE